MNVCDQCGKKIVRAADEDGCCCIHVHRYAAAVEFEKKRNEDGSWFLSPTWHGAVEEGIYVLTKVEEWVKTDLIG